MQKKTRNNVLTALLIAVTTAVIVSATLDNIGYGLAIAAVISGGIYAGMHKSSSSDKKK